MSDTTAQRPRRAVPFSNLIGSAVSRGVNAMQTAWGGGVVANPGSGEPTLTATPTGQAPPKVSPFEEAGVSGTAIFGGFIQVIERDPRLIGQNRWRTVSDMLANVSIVAAGTRFYLELVAKPGWAVEPAEDLGDGKSSDAAKAAAELMDSVLNDCATPWNRIVRRAGLYRFHGFGIYEWTAKKRDDGLIGFDDIEPRPQHTIERWQPDENGTITGVWQRSPQNGKLYWLPRQKVIYLVDDTLTDSPEGLGLFRHLIDPSDRIQRYLKLEGQGFERDLRGIPMGRAPLAALNKAVQDGTLTKEQANEALAGIRKFIKTQVRVEDTGLLIDSSAYESVTGDGFSISTKDMWGVDLLTGSANGLPDLGKAIDRLTHDMARILGCQMLLIGSSGTRSGGGRALSEDQSRNLYLMVTSTVGDIRQAMAKDAIGMACLMNGIPDEQRPQLKTEDVSFKDVADVATTLQSMAMAGAVLSPDDPAINDVRDLLGISHAPEHDPMGVMAQPTAPRPAPPGDPAERQPPARDNARAAPPPPVGPTAEAAASMRKLLEAEGDDYGPLRAWLTGRRS